MTTDNLNPNWAGYPLALQKKWAEAYRLKREAELAKSIPEDEAERLAKELRLGGFRQKSRKYRIVTRMRKDARFGTAFEQLRGLFPDKAESLTEEILGLLEIRAASILAMYDEEEKELDFATFEAFRRLGA